MAVLLTVTTPSLAAAQDDRGNGDRDENKNSRTVEFIYSIEADTSAPGLPPSFVTGYTLDLDSRGLTPIPGSPFASEPYPGPTAIALDPTGKFAYVSYIGFNPDFTSSDVLAYRIDEHTGALTPIAGSPFAVPYDSSALAVDPTGRFVYLSSSIAGGILAYRIDGQSGVLTPVPASPFPGPSGGVPVVDPTGRFVYLTPNSGGPGSIDVFAYRIEDRTGALTPLPGSPFGIAPNGGLGNLLVIDPLDNFLYVVTYGLIPIFPNTVSGYTIDRATGALTPFPGNPILSFNGSTTMAIDPTGRFAYIGTYTSEGTLAYKIDEQTGALTRIPESPFAADGCTTGDPALEPTGRFAYLPSSACNPAPHEFIWGYAIDPTTGALASIPDGRIAPQISLPGRTMVFTKPRLLDVH